MHSYKSSVFIYNEAAVNLLSSLIKCLQHSVSLASSLCVYCVGADLCGCLQMTVHCCHLVFHIYMHSNQCKCNTQTYCRTNKTCTHKQRRPFHVEIDCSSKMAAHHNMLLYQRSTLQSQFSVPRMSSLSGFTYSNISGQDNLSHRAGYQPAQFTQGWRGGVGTIWPV